MAETVEARCAGDDRLVAQVCACLGGVDRALLPGDPDAEIVHSWLPSATQEAPRGFEGCGGRDPHGMRHGSPGDAHALRRHEIGDEVPEGDGMSVVDEVGLPRVTVVGGEDQPLDGIVDVCGVGQLPAATDPGEAARTDLVDDAGKNRGVTVSPHEPRPQNDRLEIGAVGVADELFGNGL